jgi:hypothetical protein
VTDVNDNAPLFTAASYQVSLSEASPPGSRVLSVLATDADQPGPFSTVEYHVVEGPLSAHLHFPSPLEGRLLLRRPLDFEAVPELTVEVEARDQGRPPRFTRTSLTIMVLDADDQNPAFLQTRYTAELPGGAGPGHRLEILPEAMKAMDQDLALNSSLFYSLSGREDQDFSIDPASGEVTLLREPSAAQAEVTLVVRATQTDNPDRYAVATLTVLATSFRALAFSQEVYRADIVESMLPGSRVLTVSTSVEEEVKYMIDEDDLPVSQFEINPNGDIVLREALDYESDQEFSFSVTAFHGMENTTALVNITVLNVNDLAPRFGSELYRFTIGDGQNLAGHLVGRVKVADGDTGDMVTLKLRGADARAFKITSSGELLVAEPGRLNGTAEAHIVVVAEDSGTPPRSSSVPAVVRIGQGAATSRHLKVDLPNWFILWILFLILIILVVIILSLGVYICRGKSKQKASRGDSVSSLEREASPAPPALALAGRPTASHLSASSHSLGSELTTASSAAMSSRIHLPFNPSLSSCSTRVPQNGYRSPISAYGFTPSPHTPDKLDSPRRPIWSRNSLLQIGGSEDQPTRAAPALGAPQPLYSLPARRGHRVSPLTPDPRRVTPLGSSQISSSPPCSPTEEQASLQQELRARILGGGSRNPKSWAGGSIPRRVHTLSWEEASQQF